MSNADKLLSGIVDHVFTPVEMQDWTVERIRVHPSDFEEILQQGKMEMTGEIGHLWGATVEKDAAIRQRHYEVIYGDGQMKDVICSTKRNMSSLPDCGDMDCLVEAVHSH